MDFDFLTLAFGMIFGAALATATLLLLRPIARSPLAEADLDELDHKLERREVEMLLLTAFLCHVVEQRPIRPLLDSYEAGLPELMRRLLSRDALPPDWEAAMEQYDGIRDRWTARQRPTRSAARRTSEAIQRQGG